MEASPEQLDWRSVYKILIGSVLPRPIGWISTVNESGDRNLAPFSFFNVVCSNPPHVLFCPSVRSTDGKTKDTLRNVQATGQFVVNIVTEDLAEAMNISATEYPSEVDEFTEAGLTAEPSQAVQPPRVAESPIHYECQVTKIIEIGDQPGAGSVVIGKVLHLHVDNDLMIDGDKVDLEKLRPIGRLSGPRYCRVEDVFEMQRLPSQVAEKR
jgi:flavin reductase (DIM6/NTAB) family NADH-FMN oxidoreductase RutF